MGQCLYYDAGHGMIKWFKNPSPRLEIYEDQQYGWRIHFLKA